ncbi:MAG: efflux RND transporter periplasmic adaptor subunit [Cellulosilyticaceae bacterium]
MSKKAIGMIIGVLAVASFLTVGAVIPKNTETGQNIVGVKGGQRVQVAKVTEKNIESKVSASGLLTTDESQKIFSESSNRIIEIIKEVGDEVKKGEVLLLLDPEVKGKMNKEIEKLDLQLANAELALAQLQDKGSKQEILQAENNLLKAKKGIEDIQEAMRSTQASLDLVEKDIKADQNLYEVTKELVEQGLSAQKELDDLKSKLDKAEENVNTLSAKVSAFEKDLESAVLQEELCKYTLDLALNNVEDKTKTQSIAMKQNEIKSLKIQRENLMKDLEKATDEVVAPMDGVVSEVLVQEGAAISPGAPLMVIINPDKLLVQADISPFYAPQIEIGLEALIKYNGSKVIEVPAKVSMVAPSGVMSTNAGNGSATAVIPIELELLEEETGLKPGLTVDVKITTEKVENTLAVPLLATMKDDEGGSYVLVVKEDATIEKRYVTEGAADNFYVQVEGVQEGEIVVTNPTEALVDGTAVTYEAFEKQGDVK